MGRRKVKKTVQSRSKKPLLDGCYSELDKVLEEVSEELKDGSKVIFSDGEDEIDDLLEEFLEKGMDDADVPKPNSVVKLTSDDEEEMNCLLEEFSKHVSGDDSSSLKTNKCMKSAKKKKIKSKTK